MAAWRIPAHAHEYEVYRVGSQQEKSFPVVCKKPSKGVFKTWQHRAC